MRKKAGFITIVLLMLIVMNKVYATEERISQEVIEKNQNFVVEEVPTREETVMLLSTTEDEVIVVETWDISATEEDNVTAILYSDGNLIISGTGNMTNSRPWENYINNIVKVEIKDGVTSIGNSAFWKCSNLSSIIIPETIKEIEYGAFYYCSNLAEITIPEGVTDLNHYIFAGCTSLIEITIPKSVTTITDTAFRGCSSLTNIYVDNDNEHYISDNGILFNKEKSKLIKYPPKKTETEYQIPNGVISIEGSTFWECSNLTNIMIPYGTTTIGAAAFYNCSFMNIEIPNSVTDIGNMAFYKCSSLTSIEVPDSITRIKGSTFYGCRSLTSIKIPDSITTIEGQVFDGCTNLISIEIPRGVEKIGQYAFSGCLKLKNITIPYNVTNIGEGIFGSINNLETINVYEGTYAEEYVTENYSDKLNVISIVETWEISATEEDNVMTNLYSDGTLVISGIGNMKDYDFFNNTAPWYDNYRGNIKNVEIKDEVKNIGDYAFFDCIFLEKMIISDKVTYIGNYAFVDCLNLVNLEIPSSVNTIGEQVFYCCRNLSDITIPEKVMNIGDSVFDECSGLMNINVDENNNHYASENGILFNKEKSKIIKYPEGKMETEYLIPNTVVSVSIRAFSGCTNLVNIMIPKEVKRIENNAFYGCSELININVDENNNYYASEDGILFNKEKSKIIKYPEGKTEGKYIIPDSVKIIGYDSFSGCSNLSSIVILEGVEEINSNAFNICSNLSNITIPSSVKSIGITVFFGCEKLSRINVYCNSYSEEYVTQNYSDKLSIVHIYEDTITEPTCTEQGYTTHTCTRCSDSYVDNYTQTKGHSYGEWKTLKAATCTGCGTRERECNLCDKKETDTIGALEHSYSEEWTRDVEPTCTTEGSKSHHCTREKCDSKIDITPIEALNHDYKIIGSLEAVCEQGGKITYECSRCEDTYDENVPAKGHTEVIDAAAEATCTEKGKTEGKYCSVCNKVLIAQQEIPSIGHNFGDWNVTKEVTCTEDGSKERICSVCDEEEVEVITKLGHEYNSVVTTPTCTEGGYTTHICTKCSDSYIDTETDTLGHNFGAWIIDKEATYEEEGHKYRVCTNCNTEKEEETIPVLQKEELQVEITYTVKEQDNVKFAMSTVNTNVSQILSNITANREIKIIDKAGKELGANDLVGTGAKVVTKEDNKEIYTVVLEGDINCDGKVTFDDIIRTNAIRINQSESKITKAELFAADIDNSEKIEFRDIIKINAIRINNLVSNNK